MKIDIDGNKESNPDIISEHFNNYFTSIAQNLASKIPPSNVNPLSFINHQPNTFVFFECCESEIVEIINQLKNNKCSLHEIPVHIYKRVADIIAPVIRDLINDSVSNGIFPDLLKTARVVPIHKSGSKQSTKNYRPISILPTFSKIFEKVMYRRLVSFFEKYDLFSPNQYGFRSKKSTTDAIIRFTDQCYTIINDHKTLLSIYLDFSKAFDTIDHTLLCKKLQSYGIRGMTNEWFRSYLHSRNQYVSIQGSRSNVKNLYCGVPQGSILGPLLFIIYINDMQNCTHLKLIHYADDSTAYLSHDNIDTLCNTVNHELTKIDEWIKANKLSLNTDKTFYSLFTNKKINHIPDIIMRNHKISQSKSQKFLGVLVDEKLSFKEHINVVSNKISRATGVIKT